LAVDSPSGAQRTAIPFLVAVPHATRPADPDLGRGRPDEVGPVGRGRAVGAARERGGGDDRRCERGARRLREGHVRVARVGDVAVGVAHGLVGGAVAVRRGDGGVARVGVVGVDGERDLERVAGDALVVGRDRAGVGRAARAVLERLRGGHGAGGERAHHVQPERELLAGVEALRRLVVPERDEVRRVERVEELLHRRDAGRLVDGPPRGPRDDADDPGADADDRARGGLLPGVDAVPDGRERRDVADEVVGHGGSYDARSMSEVVTSSPSSTV
jgi:hypothetical protein